MLADKSAASLPRSWQPPMPPPVTKCGECKTHGDEELGVCFHSSNQSDLEMRVVYLQNERGLTITCPMWQQQNKEVKPCEQ